MTPQVHAGVEAHVGAPPGRDAEDDPRRLQVHRPVVPRDVPYVPTDEAVVAAMLRFANVTCHDIVYDLGCGDGRIVVAAAKHYGARGVGVDIDPLRIHESRQNARRARVADRTRFLCQSFFDTDFREATVVFLYLLPAINVKLRPRFLRELRPGTRIVANYFEMGDWKPDIQANVHHRVLHQWVVPAWIAGSWRCIIDAPSRRTSLILELSRRYQVVTGTARSGRHTYPVLNGRLFGDHLTFKLADPARRLPATRFACRIEGRHLRGHCYPEAIETPATPWAGVWRRALG